MSRLTCRQHGIHPLIILERENTQTNSKDEKINKINSGIQPQNLNQIVMIAFHWHKRNGKRKRCYNNQTKDRH